MRMVFFKWKHYQKTLQKKWAEFHFLQTIHSFKNKIPSNLWEKLKQTIKNQKNFNYSQLFTGTLTSWLLANITVLLLLKCLPEPKKRKNGLATNFIPHTANLYPKIVSRNLFNSFGLIPGELNPPSSLINLNGPSVPSTLPFQLLGTLILLDKRQSIATLMDKTNQTTYPMRIEDALANQLKITAIEPKKVIFINLAAQRLEHLELQPDTTKTLSYQGSSSPSGIEKVSPTQYSISRAEIDRSLENLNQILTQSRVVPNFENGVANGYKIFQIVPGSVYDKLGLQNGDVIAGLNGSPINDPGKAFEMLNELKTANHLELQVKKEGKLRTYSYDIH